MINLLLFICIYLLIYFALMKALINNNNKLTSSVAITSLKTKSEAHPDKKVGGPQNP